MISPAGRIVAGSVFKPSTKDMKGKVREKPQYFFALAIPKTDPAVNNMLNAFWQLVIENVFNNPRATVVLQSAINEFIRPKSGFAWKIDDGDHPKHADKAGYPGNWVIKFTTTIPIKCYDREARQIDPASVKTGFYVDVAMTVQPNGYFDDQAGLYVNPNMVRLLGFGEEIQPGPSALQVFGAAPAPVIGSQTPLAPAGGPTAGAPIPAPVAPSFGPAAAPAYAAAAPLYAPAPVASPLPSAPVAAPAYAPPAMPAAPVYSPAAPATPFTPPTLPDVGVQGVQGDVTGAPAPSPAVPNGASASAATASPSEPPLVGFSTGQAQ